MNLDQAAIVFRQRAPLEVVELSLLFLRSVRPGLTWRLATLVLVPLFAGGLVLRYAAGWPWLLVMGVSLGASWALELPFIVFAGKALFDPEVSLREVLTESLRRAPAFLAILLYQLTLIGLFLITAVGPLFALATSCFVLEAVVLEQASARRALSRAKELQTGRSGTGVLTVFLKLCLVAACVFLFETLGQVLWTFVLDIAAPVDTLEKSGGSPFSLFGLLLAVPLATYYRFLAYINERTELDGWDIQVAFLALARNAGPRLTSEVA